MRSEKEQMRTATIVAGTALIAVGITSPIDAQKPAISDVATHLSGTWAISRTLSPSFTTGRSGRGLAYQRGRGGGGGGSEPTPSAPGDLTPEERAEVTAMAQLEQLAPTITIAATAEAVTFTDQRGEQSCTINDKTIKSEMFGAHVGVKCRWNKLILQQEFSTTRTKLTRTWTVDDNRRLVVKSRLEQVGRSAVEVGAVYDRAASGH